MQHSNSVSPVQTSSLAHISSPFTCCTRRGSVSPIVGLTFTKRTSSPSGQRRTSKFCRTATCEQRIAAFTYTAHRLPLHYETSHTATTHVSGPRCSSHFPHTSRLSAATLRLPPGITHLLHNIHSTLLRLSLSSTRPRTLDPPGVNTVFRQTLVVPHNAHLFAECRHVRRLVRWPSGCNRRRDLPLELHAPYRQSAHKMQDGLRHQDRCLCLL